MALLAEDKGSIDYKPLSADIHIATLNALHDIGLQKTEWGVKRKVVLIWEVDERIEEGDYKGNRHIATKTYTLSMNERAALRQDVESWLGKQLPDEEIPYDLEKLLGKGCQLTIIHNEYKGRTYANVKTITKLPKDHKGIQAEMEPGYKPKFIDSLRAKALDEEEATRINAEIKAAQKDKEPLPLAGEERVPW